VDNMPLPGVAVTVLVVGASATLFYICTNLVAMRFRGTPAADAWLDLLGHGAVQPTAS
jgi:hypothetical protein